jgi:hypothetical protein
VYLSVEDTARGGARAGAGVGRQCRMRPGEGQDYRVRITGAAAYGKNRKAVSL